VDNDTYGLVKLCTCVKYTLQYNVLTLPLILWYGAKFL